MASSFKKRLGAVLAVASMGLSGAAMVGINSAAAAPSVPYAGQLTDAFSGSTANRAAVDTLTNTAFEMATSMLYTVAKFLVDFVSQPTVLAVLVGLAVIYMLVMRWVRKVKKGGHLG